MPDNLSQFSTAAENLGVGGPAGGAINAVVSGLDGLKKFGSAVSNILKPGAAADTKGGGASATVADTIQDWRVSLSIPPGSYQNSPTLNPIWKINKFVFPYTPSIQMSHSASYSAMDPVHGNYSFMSYENSKVDKISITGDFYCEDSAEAEYWVAAVHYLRSVTKMYFGANSENAGAPPPVLKLNGYGDFVFSNVPVVVTNFSVDLPKDVDYIPTKFYMNELSESTVVVNGVGYAPVRSTITVTLQPVYSRSSVRNFNLQDFVNGTYIKGGVGGGFI
jgi:hypothetical protein